MGGGLRVPSVGSLVGTYTFITQEKYAHKVNDYYTMNHNDTGEYNTIDAQGIIPSY